MQETAGLSHPGLVRANNEDRFYSSAGAGLCVLADGLGGAEAGETASSLAVEAVAEFLTRTASTPALLHDAFLAADARVRAAAAGRPALTGMGTTLVAALRTTDGIAVANAGDSRCWLWEHGRLMQVTRDQSWAQEVARRRGLSDAEVSVHPLRHAVTNAVGVGNALRVQHHALSPAPGSLLLLSSDGLHEMASADGIAGVLARGGTLPVLCRGLVDLALAHGGADNVTVVLARC
jgi:protein phosphatase